MTISIRIWRLDLYFELKLHAEPDTTQEPGGPGVMPTMGFFMPGPSFTPDDL